MKARRYWILALVLFIFFALAINYRWYDGYFQDDELDTMAWSPFVRGADWWSGFLTPLFLPLNFRPAAHAFFPLCERAFGLWFPGYFAALQLILLVDGLLLAFLCRRLGLQWSAVLLAEAFLLANYHLFDAYFKPMYVYDVLCGTFCLASVLLYVQRRTILAFACFWLAYKSKELAVMLPVSLAFFELFLGDRNWKRLVPFFAVSLSFGLQGMYASRRQHNSYTFHFSLRVLASTLKFYAPLMTIWKWGWAILLLIPAVFRDRRIGFGAIIMASFLFPLLFLPGRIFPAYLYVPSIGGAVMVAVFFNRFDPRWALATLTLICAVEALKLPGVQTKQLQLAAQNREYVSLLAAYAATHSAPHAIVFDGLPAHFENLGSRRGLQHRLASS